MIAPIWTSEPEIEILDLRHFSASSLRPLLEEEREVWSNLLAWDYRSSAEMILRYVDGKILPGYVALQHGSVEGYCFFVYEGSKGVIGDLYVTAASSNGHRIEQRLLSHSIATLQQSPGIHRVEAQLLLHETGVVAEPFAIERFRRYPRLFMTKRLQGPSGSAGIEPAISMPAGIEIRRWSDNDYQAAAAAINASYRGHIDSEINDQYRSLQGSLRFLNNIVRFPGCGIFDRASSFVALHRPSRTMIGLVLCSKVKESVGHVTQVCLLPEFRGHCIGHLLLRMTTDELRRRNYRMISLTVTEANAGAVRLYRRLGYQVHRAFDAFVWEG